MRRLFLSHLLIFSIPLQAATPAWRPKCAVPKPVVEPVTREGLRSFFSAKENQAALRDSKDLLDTLVCCLPSRTRTQPILGYRTGSQQKADWLTPRAILSGDSFPVLAFDATSESLEIQDIAADKSIHFHKLVAETMQNVKLHADEKECVSCHRGRSLWQSYFIWPGMYGSEEDALFRSSPNAATKIEQDKFAEYQKHRKTALRYRCLIEPEDEDYVAPKARYDAEYEQAQEVSKRRNFRFGAKLFDANLQRVGEFLATSKGIEPFRSLLLGTLKCSGVKPDDMRRWLISAVPETAVENFRKLLIEETTKSLPDKNANVKAAIKQLEESLGQNSEQSRVAKTKRRLAHGEDLNGLFEHRVAFRMIIERYGGLDASNMSLIRGDRNFIGLDGTRDFFLELVDLLSQKWIKTTKVDCDKLAKSSKAALDLAHFDGVPIYPDPTEASVPSTSPPAHSSK